MRGMAGPGVGTQGAPKPCFLLLHWELLRRVAWEQVPAPLGHRSGPSGEGISSDTAPSLHAEGGL